MQEGEKFAPGFRQLLQQFAELRQEGRHDRGGSHPYHDQNRQQAKQQRNRTPAAEPPPHHTHQGAQGHRQHHGGEEQHDRLAQAPDQQQGSHKGKER